MSFLALTDIRKSFGAEAVVKDFNLTVERGELVTFLGPSGCGKTTTLRMIAGFETPTDGSIRIDGREVTHLSARRRAIGMVFQAYALFPNMTVERNIAFGLKVAGKPAAQIKARVDEMLAIIKLPDLAGRYPHQLSGGQQQRVSLARALAPSPQILLLDEPLSALDARIRAGLREDIRALQRKLGITTIFVRVRQWITERHQTLLGSCRRRAAEIGVANARISSQVLGRALQHDASVLQHIGLM